MIHDSHPPVTTLNDSAFAVSFDLLATPEAKVARALASLPMFEGWTHEPTPSDLESRLMELDEQALMTAAAVCLLRLAKSQHHAPDDHADADAA